MCALDHSLDAWSKGASMHQPHDWENLTVIQTYFPHYKVRKIYILPPISEGLCGKLPMRRALNLWNMFSSIKSNTQICEQGLISGTLPWDGRDELSFSGETQGQGSRIFPPRSSPWSGGYLVHQIPVIASSHPHRHKASFPLPSQSAEGHHT